MYQLNLYIEVSFKVQKREMNKVHKLSIEIDWKLYWGHQLFSTVNSLLKLWFFPPPPLTAFDLKLRQKH